MNLARRVAAVRKVVVDTVAKIRPGNANTWSEVILIRDGRFAGWRFEFEDVRAVWLAESDRIEVTFDDEESPMVVSLNDLSSDRRAA